MAMIPAVEVDVGAELSSPFEPLSLGQRSREAVLDRSARAGFHQQPDSI
jgi:hypothetical protein